MDAQEVAIRTLELARGGVANVTVAVNVQNQVAGYNSSIEDFVDWIAEIDHFFEYIDIPQEKRVKLVACRLKDGALPGGKDCYIDDRERVNSLFGHFMRLAERNDLRESEVHQVSRYLDGLKLQIRDRIGVQVVKSVMEEKNLAIKVELMLRDRGGSRIEANR
ncbi:hypothetical protein M9H77_07437 [Catharanthus roseus]|uniref:Uncharacterized protein n=1 Tax=Catharanthus roseus TaxID=4058 RepID=A0ACC0BV67_CATRO|nr:hypothetical protein M9H77_07437 [Catharanthus roseus]